MEKQNHLIKRLCADARTPLSQSSPSVCWISTSPTVSERGRGSSARWQRRSREGGLFVNLKKIKKKTKKKKRDDMHIKQEKQKMKNTFFKNCKRFFVFVFDILSAIRREQLLSLSEGQRAPALEAKGHRLSQVPRAERWGWRGGRGCGVRWTSVAQSETQREGGGKRVSENMKTNTKTTN